MDDRVVILGRVVSEQEARLGDLEETLRTEIERTALLSAELRMTREKLQNQMEQIEKSTKSLAPISENLAQAYTRSQNVQEHIPDLIRETIAADTSFAHGHEKARRLATALSTHTAHWTTKLMRILRREAPPDRYTVAMAAVHAALFLTVLGAARWVAAWVGWEILRRYVEAKRPHVHQLLGLEPRT
ncbi:hypothetical protein BDV93DRAFT_606503 [Ceratobasidium sp. AG-I]|nr:hypothetical protein BDV93DRAFT_606503 [Ceratobasidium sp. AG-I]